MDEYRRLAEGMAGFPIQGVVTVTPWTYLQ